MIAALYTDGGCIKANPSKVGGTWAWCQVNAAGERLAHESGVVTPSWAGLPTISNNLTELLAMLYGLEGLPDGWAGRVYTDSQCTLFRVDPGRKKTTWKNVPPDLVQRVQGQKKRLGLYTVHLLGGHPSRAELAAGRRKDGLPCSPHNVWCDKACTDEALKFLGGVG